MKRSALDRYERDDEGNIVVDVSATRIEDLYNDFDKSAPYIRRDLDQDFADYLSSCVRELNRVPFIVRLSLAHRPDEARASRIRRSLNTYFQYLAETEIREILQMFRRSAILFTIGLGIMFTSVWLSRMLGPERSMSAGVIVEGLTVAAWVSLWEALAIFLIEWSPHRRNVALYRRLARARLVFRSTAEAEQEPKRESDNQPTGA